MTRLDAAIDWERVKALFGAAMELDAAGRAAFLDREAVLPALRREVEALLAQHDQGGDLMAAPTLGSASHELPTLPVGPGHGAPPLPETLGHYRIGALLGHGGMGEVYRAHDPRLDRDVALKVLPAGLARHPTRRERFLREARAAASLNHANITTIHEIGAVDGRDYIAFELVDGRSLRDILAGGRLGLDELLDIAAPIADALAYAHERGIVHRDVKAANVMVTGRGVPKLLDFGLAKLLGAPDDAEGANTDTHLTASGAIFGTPGAMSPEQALGRAVDHRTDIYSFGSLLYEMACGVPPFAGETAMEVMHAVIDSAPTPLEQQRPDLPDALVSIVERALRKQPAERYQDIAEMAADLALLRRQTTTGMVLPVRRRRSRGRRLAAVSLGVVLLATGALGWRMGWFGDAFGGGASSAAADNLLAVMGFENLGDPADSDQLGAMLARLVTTELSTASGIRMLSQQRLYDIARSVGSPDGRVDRSVATEVARRGGVRTMVLGQVAHVGGTLVATLELMDVASGRTLGNPEAHGEDDSDVFAMAEALGRQVRALLQAPAATPDERRAIEMQLTDSVDAYRAFVRGHQALERNDIHAAIAAFRQATSLDPTFALAYYRQAMATVWTGGETRPAFEKALAFREKLPDELRRVLDGIGPYLFNDRMSAALPFLLEIVRDDPGDRDALYHLGEIYTHSSVWNDAGKAAATYETLLGFDPGFTLLWEHQLNAYLRAGRFDVAHARLDGWRSLAPEKARELDGLLALWEGHLRRATGASVDPVEVALLADDRDAPALAELLASDVPAIQAALGDKHGLYLAQALGLRADALACYGRFDDAERLYDEATRVQVVLSPDGYLTNTQNSARHRHAALLALRGKLPAARALADEALSLQPESYRCLSVALRYALLDGDAASARRHLAALESLADEARSPTAPLYRDAAAADLALFEGRPAAARALLAPLVASGRAMEDWYAFSDSAGSLWRAALARACLALDDAPGARAALDGLLACGLERARHPVPWVSALLARGTLALDAGDEATGRALLTRYLACWGEADAALAGVRAARERLGR